jgi:hypothetical protein
MKLRRRFTLHGKELKQPDALTSVHVTISRPEELFEGGFPEEMKKLAHDTNATNRINENYEKLISSLPMKDSD